MSPVRQATIAASETDTAALAALSAHNVDRTAHRPSNEAALRTALDEAAADGGGYVRLKPGTTTYSADLDIPGGVLIEGSGRGSSLVPTTNTIRVRFNGTSGAVRNRRTSVHGVSFDGNAQTISRLVESVYADRLFFSECSFGNLTGCAFYGVDLWDSRFDNCRSNNAGATGVPAFLFRSIDTGYTPADTVNNLYFTGTVWETFTGGAMWAERNGGGNPSVIRLSDCKAESAVASGTFYRMSGSVYCSIDNVRCHLSGGSGGMDIVQLSGYYHDVRGLTVTSSGVVSARTGLRFGETGITSGWSTIDNLNADWSTAPSVALLEYVNSPVNIAEGAIASGVGTLISGSRTFAASHPIRRVAGVVSDASFYEPPSNGILAVDETNNRLYVKVGGVWRFAALT